MPERRGRVCVCCRKMEAAARATDKPPAIVRGPFRSLARIERQLRADFPVPDWIDLTVRRVAPATFVRQHGFRCFGDCIVDESRKTAAIRLGTDLAERELVDTLVHEWPHVLRFLSPVPGTPHDAVYWQLHGQIYRAVYGD